MSVYPLTYTSFLRFFSHVVTVLPGVHVGTSHSGGLGAAPRSLLTVHLRRQGPVPSVLDPFFPVSVPRPERRPSLLLPPLPVTPDVPQSGPSQELLLDLNSTCTTTVAGHTAGLQVPSIPPDPSPTSLSSFSLGWTAVLVVTYSPSLFQPPRFHSVSTSTGGLSLLSFRVTGPGPLPEHDGRPPSTLRRRRNRRIPCPVGRTSVEPPYPRPRFEVPEVSLTLVTFVRLLVHLSPVLCLHPKP